MVGWLVLAEAAAQERPVAAVLRTADRAELDARGLVPSGDGALVLVHGPEKATVLGAADGAVRTTVALHGIEAGSVAPNGRFALVHEGGTTVHAPDGREELRLGAFGRVTGVALSPDGSKLAIASTQAVVLHDAVDGKLAWTSEGAAEAVLFSADGRAVIATRGGAPVALSASNGSPGGGTPPPTVAGFLPGGCAVEDGGGCPVPGSPAFVRDDHMLVVRDGALERWRLLFEEQVDRVALDGAPARVTWAGDDLVVALEDGRVRRLTSGGEVRLDATAPGCSGACALAGVGGFGDETWAAGPGGALQRWDGGGTPLVKKPRPIGGLALTRLADGRWVSLGVDARVRVGEEPGKGRPTPPLAGAAAVDATPQVVVAWSDQALLVAAADGSARAAPALGPGRRPRVAALSPDGATLALIDDQGVLHAYRTEDARALYRLPLGLEGRSLAWTPDGARLLVGGPTLRVFAAADGTPLAEVVLGGEVAELAVSASGRIAARAADAVFTVPGALIE